MNAAPSRPLPVLLALATGGFAIGTTEFAAMGLLPDIERSFSLDAPAAGHLISLYALGVVVGAPVMTVLAASLSRRAILLVLMTLFTLGNGLSAVAPSDGWLLLARFAAGLPHGAYFGVASVVAASLVPTDRRARVVGQMMLGLTVATVVGVPLATRLGDLLGWRWSFGVVALLGLLTLMLLLFWAPRDRGTASSPLRELAVLRRGQVWLTLAIGAIGFGGLFAVYTFLTSIIREVTHAPPSVAAVVLGVFGLGFTAGALVVPRFADRALMPTAGALLLWSAFWLVLFPFTAHSVPLMALDVFFIGCGTAIAVVLQTRLMDISGDAQNLPAALNHAAFNLANAFGPWAAGLAIGAGYGLLSVGPVGCTLALAGFVVWAVAYAGDRRRTGATLEATAT
ncbi:MFS transporter [Rhizosaccharibacter radicis]|uniref:MFS transporter n=1 Tax=Rhizosaccharibacter radicis TaxID=2782605 RepID=A0ABT1VV52_9PROT|nr:MFS transporter [Acetobacteraceae bacterium KSS12]